MINPQNLFYLTLSATLIVRLLVAYYLPIIGDEAYFILWARNPDYGYYDHPPMVAWLLAAFLTVSDHPLWFRLPTVLILSLTGWIIYRLLRDKYPDTAVYAGMFYLLVPINMVGVLLLTDTPLVLWSFLSALAFYKAQQNDSYTWYTLAGLLLGLAFYSKFFAVLLGLSYLLYLLLFIRRGLRPYIGLLLLLAACTPFVVMNLLWNYHHCWNNYLFNLVNRTQGAHLSIVTLLKYLGWLLYLMTPPVIYYFVKQRRYLWQQLKQNDLGVFPALFILPVLLFVFIASSVSIGLHWLLSFLPMLVLGLALMLDIEQFRKCFYFLVPYGLLHVAGLFILLALMPGVFHKNENIYKDVIYGYSSKEILQEIKPYLADYHLATESYSESALLAYAVKRHVMVLGPGSHHGRQDDLLTDFRTLHGDNILILNYSHSVERYSRYFDQFEVHPLRIADTTFYYALGRGFKYPLYRDEVLLNIIDYFYALPEWLPVGICYMYERYIFD